MSIEFRCTECQKLLAVPAGTSGQKAKCPQCGTVLTIPEASPAAEAEGVGRFDAPPPREPGFAASAETPPPRNPEPVGGVPSGEANPYQAPAGYNVGSANTRPIDLSETFNTTWQIYKANLGACIGGSLVMFICSFVAAGATQALLAPIGFKLGGGALVGLWLLQQVAAQAVTAFFYIGIILFMLRIARGQSADFGQLFAGGPLLVFGATVQIIVYLATLGGFILLIIPGIIIALMLSQSMFILVDRRTDIGGALKLSVAAMKGNKMTVLGIWIVGGLAAMMFSVFTCGIGFLFAMPFMTLLATVIYLRVTGQATAVDGGLGYGVERPFSAPGMQPT